MLMKKKERCFQKSARFSTKMSWSNYARSWNRRRARSIAKLDDNASEVFSHVPNTTKKKETIMRRKQIVSTLFLAGAVMAMNSASASAQSVGGTQSERSGTDTQTPVPPKSPSSGLEDAGKTGKSPSKPSGKAQGSKDKSVGGSQSERSGTDTQTPVPSKSRSSGAGDKSNSGMSKSAGKNAPSKGDTSVGASQSERSGTDTQTPLPPESPSSGKSSTK